MVFSRERWRGVAPFAPRNAKENKARYRCARYRAFLQSEANAPLHQVQPCVGAGTRARHSASGNGKRLKMLWVGSALGSVLRSPKRRVSIQRCPPSKSK